MLSTWRHYSDSRPQAAPIEVVVAGEYFGVAVSVYNPDVFFKKKKKNISLKIKLIPFAFLIFVVVHPSRITRFLPINRWQFSTSSWYTYASALVFVTLNSTSCTRAAYHHKLYSQSTYAPVAATGPAFVAEIMWNDNYYHRCNRNVCTFYKRRHVFRDFQSKMKNVEHGTTLPIMQVSVDTKF